MQELERYKVEYYSEAKVEEAEAVHEVVMANLNLEGFLSGLCMKGRVDAVHLEDNDVVNHVEDPVDDGIDHHPVLPGHELRDIIRAVTLLQKVRQICELYPTNVVNDCAGDLPQQHDENNAKTVDAEHAAILW